jgi:hypothetical protein
MTWEEAELLYLNANLATFSWKVLEINKEAQA